MAKSKELLEDLVKVDGINAAVIVARDGFVIDGVSNGEAWIPIPWAQLSPPGQVPPR